MASSMKISKKILVLSVLCFALLLVMAVPAYTKYEYTELQLGWRWLTATDINDDGVVVGYGFIGKEEFLNQRGFIYSNGKYTELLPPGWAYARATGINNRGEVVGEGNVQEYRDTADDYRGFIYKDGTYTEISPPWPNIGVNSILGITDNGEVVGTLGKLSGFPYHHAFIYWQGEYRSFMRNRLFSRSAQYKSINNNCAIVGGATLFALPPIIGIVSGFVYREGIYTWLLPPGHLPSTANGINDHGAVVGTSDYNGFIYQYGRYTWLMPPGCEYSGASAINNNGTVVGWGQDGTGKSKLFVYSNGTYTELLVGSPLYVAINNNGTVAVTLQEYDSPLGEFDSPTHVFIAVPKSN